MNHFDQAQHPRGYAGKFVKVDNVDAGQLGLGYDICFNGDYGDVRQVEHLYPAYLATRDEAKADGLKCRRSTDLMGRIPALADHPHERALLQCLGNLYDQAGDRREPQGEPPKPFTFNGDSGDYRQVLHLKPAYDELLAASGRPFLRNSDVVGMRGLEGATGRDAESAAYLLSRLHDREEIDRKVAAFIAEGGREVRSWELSETPMRVRKVAHHSFFSGGTGWIEYDNKGADIRVREAQGDVGLLKGRARTRGQRLYGRVLILE